METKKILIRFPKDLYENIQKLAEMDDRTFTGEVIQMLILNYPHRKKYLEGEKKRLEQLTEPQKAPASNEDAATKKSINHRKQKENIDEEESNDIPEEVWQQALKDMKELNKNDD